MELGKSVQKSVSSSVVFSIWPLIENTPNSVWPLIEKFPNSVWNSIRIVITGSVTNLENLK